MKLLNIIRNALRKENVHFLLILSCVFMQMIDLGWAYRFFAYANLIAVLVSAFYVFKKPNNVIDFKPVKYLFVLTTIFFFIHFIAIKNLILIKEMRHILLAIFLAIGVYFLDGKEEKYVRKNIFKFVLIILSAYVALQAAYLWGFHQPFGTTKNPHYLALYSGISIIVAIYCFLEASTLRLKLFLSGCIFLLGIFLIQSLSRPAWLGLVVAGVLSTFFLKRKLQIYSILMMVFTVLALFITDAGGFAERSKDLVGNVRTEERVAIWKDDWRMQSDSSLSEWIVGHGIDSFEESFMPYSSYHNKGIDFNSPHNYLLELIFTTGIVGTALAFVIFFLVCKCLIQAIKLNDQYKGLYIMLGAVLTSTITLTSITLPFFSSHSINVIALVVGVMLYLGKNE